MRLEPIWPKASFGVRILDVDLASDDKQISRLIHQHKVVVIDSQYLSETQYIDFAKGLGEVVPFKFKNYSLAGRPEIMILDNQAHLTGVGGRRVGNMWHSDSSYQERPLDLTLLLAKKVPEGKFGGQTLFIDTGRALSQLESPVITKLENLGAYHEVLWTYKVTKEDVGTSLKELVDELRRKNSSVVHPCISTHPRTGVRNLNINPGYTTSICGLTSQDSADLLRQIFSVALDEANIFAYEWRANDLLIWDNRSVWHKATPVGSSAERVMHRIGVQEVNDGNRRS